MSENNLKTLPVDIFLTECGADVDWCEDKIEDNDIHYIRADIVDKDMDELKETISDLRDICMRNINSRCNILREAGDREIKLIRAAFHSCESLAEADDFDSAVGLLYERAGLCQEIHWKRHMT